MIFLLLLPHENLQKKIVMSVFGIVLFLLIGGMAFWMLLFLLGFVVPFWISLGIGQQMRPKRVFEKETEEEAK